MRNDRRLPTVMSLISIFRTQKCRSESDFIGLRTHLKKYGINKFHKEMTKAGIFEDNKIATKGNPFAEMLSGQRENPYNDQNHGVLNNGKYVFFQNRPENDKNWQNPTEEWLGRASMSQRHKMLSPVYNHWSNFNVLTLGLSTEFGLNAVIDELNDMEQLALDYVKRKGWSGQTGLYFHCFPFNSIMTLHLHIIDLNTVGPSYNKLQYKNLPLDIVRQVLIKEKN